MSEKQTILIIEDDRAISNFISRALTANDYRAITAFTGKAGLSLFFSHGPDLVLLDYEMPVCDGRQTLEMLRSEKAFADIPVIFLTGRSDPDVVRALLALKPAGYLLKYLKPDDIKQKIGRFLRRAE